MLITTPRSTTPQAMLRLLKSAVVRPELYDYLICLSFIMAVVLQCCNSYLHILTELLVLCRRDEYGFSVPMPQERLFRDTKSADSQRKAESIEKWNHFFARNGMWSVLVEAGKRPNFIRSVLVGTSAASQPVSSSSSPLPLSPAQMTAILENDEFQRLVEEGVPRRYRAVVWKILFSQHSRKNVSVREDAVATPAKKSSADMWWGSLPYREYLSRVNTNVLSQIDRDVPRTFSTNEVCREPSFRMQLRNVLAAYSARNTAIGYCQGMNYLVATIMLHVRDEYDVFELATILFEEIIPRDYFLESMFGYHVDQAVLEACVREYIPAVAAHLDEKLIPMSCFSCAWLLCLGVEALPFGTAMYLWDQLLSQGFVVVFRWALALISLHQDYIFNCTDAGTCLSAMRDSLSQLFSFVDLASEMGKYSALTSVRVETLRQSARHHLSQDPVKRNSLEHSRDNMDELHEMLEHAVLTSTATATADSHQILLLEINPVCVFAKGDTEYITIKGEGFTEDMQVFLDESMCEIVELDPPNKCKFSVPQFPTSLVTLNLRLKTTHCERVFIDQIDVFGEELEGWCRLEDGELRPPESEWSFLLKTD